MRTRILLDTSVNASGVESFVSVPSTTPTPTASQSNQYIDYGT